MAYPTGLQIPKFASITLSHLYEIERKLKLHGDPGSIQRNVDRIKASFEDEKLFFEDPMGQPFNETRTDLEATISGESTENLMVVEVIKPIIRAGEQSLSRVVQKGIVVVKSTDQTLEEYK